MMDLSSLSGGHLVMRDNSWILRVFEFEGNQVDERGWIYYLMIGKSEEKLFL